MNLLISAPVTYDNLLLILATWVLRGCAVWALLIGLAVLVEAGTSGRVRATSWVATPPAMRRALLAGMGVLLAGAAPGPVSAAVVIGSPHRPTPLVNAGTSAAPRALPVPARPLGTLRQAVVRVRPGDTLWGLAAARLPQEADDAAVLAAVHRWYSRNRHTIGADPNLLLPNQRLTPPRSAHHRSREESR